jgi:hypothetical protein
MKIQAPCNAFVYGACRKIVEYFVMFEVLTRKKFYTTHNPLVCENMYICREKETFQRSLLAPSSE